METAPLQKTCGITIPEELSGSAAEMFDQIAAE